MTVSIIIAVRGLNDNLKECLKNCLELDYSDFEVIVFPDGKFTYDNPKVRIIPTGAISPPKKRDFALKEAKGEILAFLDDDAYPVTSWLNAAMPHFDKDNVAAVAGPAVTPLSDGLREQASGAVYESILVSGIQSFRYKPKKMRYVDDFPSCNFLVRKSIFEKLGGFRVEFWPGEDTILCLGITQKLNQKIIYNPQVLVFHHRRPLYIAHLRQIANYALHRGYFVKRFPQNSLRLSYFIPSAFLVFAFLGGIISFFCSKFSYLYLWGMYIYLVLVLIFSLSKDLRMVFLKFSGIMSTHLVYGFFFLKGLLSHRLLEENESNNFLPAA